MSTRLYENVSYYGYNNNYSVLYGDGCNEETGLYDSSHYYEVIGTVDYVVLSDIDTSVFLNQEIENYTIEIKSNADAARIIYSDSTFTSLHTATNNIITLELSNKPVMYLFLYRDGTVDYYQDFLIDYIDALVSTFWTDFQNCAE